jgi:hypothetical protein
MNKPLLKYLCQIGGIDYYSVPDHARLLLRSQGPSPWYEPNMVPQMPANVAYIQIWRVKADGSDEPEPDFVVKAIGGKVLVDSTKAPPRDDEQDGRFRGIRGMLFCAIPILLDDQQYAKAQELEAAANPPPNPS